MNINGVELRTDFGDPLGEARACRNDCALFDFSFVATARVSGSGAQKAVEKFASRSLASLAGGRIAYALRVNDKGQTALAAAVFRQSEPIVRLLLEAGADPALGPRSALAIAEFFDLPAMAALLRQPVD